MEAWYIENQIKVENMFGEIEDFINTNNIHLRTNIEYLFKKFLQLAYNTSNKPFKPYNYINYDVKKNFFNDDYDISIGSYFFDLLYDLKLYFQEYDKLFLCRIETHSLQNFFENNFYIDNLKTLDYIDYDQDDIHDNNYIDY